MPALEVDSVMVLRFVAYLFATHHAQTAAEQRVPADGPASIGRG